MSDGTMDDNSPVREPAALLLAPDPTGQSDVKFEYIRDLSDEEHERYQQAHKTLSNILFANPFTYFRGSAQLFYEVWTRANKAFAAGEVRPNADPDSFYLWATQLRSASLTLCLSLAYHQENTYQEVCDKHGTDSEAHLAVKVVFGELYDTYDGYRYMYALRNAMAHDAMDAIALEAMASLDASGNPIALWDMKLDRAVLSRSKKVKSAIRAEFDSLTENPSLPTLFAQIAEPMRLANRRLVSIVHPDLTQVCQVAKEFDSIFGDKVGTRALAHDRSPQLRPGMKVGFSSWSNALIEFARSYQEGQEI
jgi:hypothetical protein